MRKGGTSNLDEHSTQVFWRYCIILGPADLNLQICNRPSQSFAYKPWLWRCCGCSWPAWPFCPFWGGLRKNLLALTYSSISFTCRTAKWPAANTIWHSPRLHWLFFLQRILELKSMCSTTSCGQQTPRSLANLGCWFLWPFSCGSVDLFRLMFISSKGHCEPSACSAWSACTGTPQLGLGGQVGKHAGRSSKPWSIHSELYILLFLFEHLLLL